MTLAQLSGAPFWSKLLHDFRWHYGQPEEVRREFRIAMGLERRAHVAKKCRSLSRYSTDVIT